eukprot:5487909-Ditylum_brightwellii.AAC.1
MPVCIMQQQASQDTQNEALLTTPFMDYLGSQPTHVKCILRNLMEQDTNPDYQLQALNEGKVMIATDGLVAEKKGYFAVVLYTEEAEL